MRRVPSSVSEARTCSSEYLFFILLKHLLQLHALTPARTIANLCTLRSTKFCAQDILHGLAHLRLEPQCDSSGILLGAFQEQLVVHPEQKVGAGAVKNLQHQLRKAGLNLWVEGPSCLRLLPPIGDDRLHLRRHVLSLLVEYLIHAFFHTALQELLGLLGVLLVALNYDLVVDEQHRNQRRDLGPPLVHKRQCQLGTICTCALDRGIEPVVDALEAPTPPPRHGARRGELRLVIGGPSQLVPLRQAGILILEGLEHLGGLSLGPLHPIAFLGGSLQLLGPHAVERAEVSGFGVVPLVLSYL